MYKELMKSLVVTLILLFITAGAERLGRCPNMNTECTGDTNNKCDSDNDCTGERKCCEQQCGRICVEPLYTGCENMQVSVTRVLRALALEGGGTLTRRMRTPRCRTNDGEFERIQCNNEIVPSCWCVDESGDELAGTRAPAASLVNCTSQAACAAHTCRMLCPHGFELDKKGCPLCKCRDPCSEFKCPSSLSCQLEEKPCIRPPCPPIPTCKRGRSLHNICPVGEPLIISETHRPYLCGNDPGKPNCPPLHRCLVERGNDYGVCCPASLELQKAGSCPAKDNTNVECGTMCSRDLECPSVQKCCDSNECGNHCVMPLNVTICLQQKLLAELLSVSEKEGRGYIPQCSPVDGKFETRQCSRNGLVCWCVDSEGNKLRGSMGPSAAVNCSSIALTTRGSGRSMGANKGCDREMCAAVCEYGYKVDTNGCPTCECDDPCIGFNCGPSEECLRVKDNNCSGSLCNSYPVCRPKVTYENPCEFGTPSINDTTGEVITCSIDDECPLEYTCTKMPRSMKSICCPVTDEENLTSKMAMCPTDIEDMCERNTTIACESDSQCNADDKCCPTEGCGSVCIGILLNEAGIEDIDKSPSMCEYLRDFDEKMEGTQDGMRLALSQPMCYENGSYVETQCTKGDKKECWCVDGFGTEIPRTRGDGAPLSDCVKLRTEIDCLDLTCRMGCDYGFELDPESRCPTCQCRNPCSNINCGSGEECRMVDVACDGEYCPAVPACFPRKLGQCPYLVPKTSQACELTCSSDNECSNGERCCPTGCGTSCTKPIFQTACEQQRAVALHQASERGIPGSKLWLPTCREDDGIFEQIQCQGDPSVCWCVDEIGREIPGTRKYDGKMPDCENPSTCPVNDCLNAIEECEYGPELGKDGCPSCKCLDPCNDVKCSEDEVCSLVDVECTSEQCPRLARCVAASACPGGASPIMLSQTSPLTCGPGAAACPSTHSCQLQPHRNSPPVCCPKPRTVCFEPKDDGKCDNSTGANLTRWYFNPAKNRCEKFHYSGCSGNHNNFHSEDMCNKVCPVLSACERLREKNAQLEVKYSRPTFKPVCDSESGKWLPVQCMANIDVCWCVNPRGEPLKGTLVRGNKPDCNFRTARKRGQTSQADEVLEELIRQMTSYRIDDFDEDTELLSDSSESRQMDAVATADINIQTKCLSMKEAQIRTEGRSAISCEPSGVFSPMQCIGDSCWCVDEAGNVVNNGDKFKKGDRKRLCPITRVESVDVELSWSSGNVETVDLSRKNILRVLKSLHVQHSTLVLMNDNKVTRLSFTLHGHNSVKAVHQLEQMVHNAKIEKNETNSTIMADIIKVEYRTSVAKQPETMRQREILTESTVSMTTPYHTAIIVLAASSAFIISVLSVLLMLYRKQVSKLGDTTKTTKAEDRFLPYEPPVYVLSTEEKADLAKAMKVNEMQSEKV